MIEHQRLCRLAKQRLFVQTLIKPDSFSDYLQPKQNAFLFILVFEKLL